MTRGYGLTRRREGGAEWIAAAATHPVLEVPLPAAPPFERYVSVQLAI